MPPIAPGALLPFVQLELTRPLGPSEGSYVVRSEGVLDTLVLARAEAEPALPAAFLRRRPRAVRVDAPAPVPVTIVTHVRASQACADRPAAEALLASWRASDEQAWAVVERTLDVVNLALRAHRLAERDPYVAEVEAAEPRAIRIGYGTPDDVLNGRWAAAFQPTAIPRRRDRDRQVRVSVALADVLAGRHEISAAAELLLRAEADVDQRRAVCAGWQLHAAAQALVATAPGDAAAERLAERARELAAAPDLAACEQLADALWAHLSARA